MKRPIILLLLFMPLLLPAHPISISWATLHASRDKISLQLNVLAEDLFLYHGLEADANGFFPAEQLSQAAEQHQEFLSRYFFLEALQGQKLYPDFLRLQKGSIPKEGIHKDSLMQHSLLYFFEFKTPPAIPGVQVHQQFGGSLSPIPALVMVTAYQEGASGSLTAELSRERPWLLRFNWESPDLFARNKGFGRFSREEGPSASICIDESGIRQELVLPFEKLETLLPLKRKAPSRLSAAEEQQAQREAIAFFTERIRVTANGRPAALSSAMVEFETGTEEPDQPLLPDRPVKVSLSYSIAPPLDSVSISWEIFNWQARSWKAEIRAFGETERHTFSRYRPEYFWMR